MRGATLVLLLVSGTALGAERDELLARWRQATDLLERERIVRELGSAPVTVLREVLEQDPEERIRLVVVAALASRGEDEAGRALLGALSRWDPFVTEAALRGIAERGLPGPTVEWILAEARKQGGSTDRRAALLELLGRLERDEARPLLRAAADEKAWRLRAGAAIGLAALDPRSKELRRLARDEHLAVRVRALAGLEHAPEPAAQKLLEKAVRTDPAWQARLSALRALRGRDPAGTRALAAQVLADDDQREQVRREALVAVAPWQDPVALEAVRKAQRGARGRFAADLQRALTPGGDELPDDPRRTRVRFYGLAIESEAACFVIDASGSMSERAGGPRDETKWQVARKELAQALAALPEGARFGLVLFHERLVPLAQTPVPATRANQARALALLDAHAPAGATDLHAPLAAVFHAGEPEDPAAAERVEFDTLVLLTDGLPTAGVVIDPAELLRRVRGWNRWAGVRIHAVGLGQQDQDLLSRLASESGGRFVSRQ